jgi:arylformamidase
MQEVLQRRAAASDAVRARLGAPRRLAYGPSEIERVDVYPTSRARTGHDLSPRRRLARRRRAQPGLAAETFVRAGAHWVVPDFATVMDVGLEGMVAQVRRAVAWVAQNAASFGGDAARIYVGGHSSGGHLAGNVLVTDWAKDFGLPADLVKGGLCTSGMYDLKAVRLSARSSYVKFDDRIEHELSPLRHLDRLSALVVVAYASNDSPEFQRQSREFAAALERIGRLCRLVVGEGHNHFELPETLASPDSLLGRAALELMELG